MPLESIFSSPIKAMVTGDITAPAKVLNLAFTVSQGKVSLTWDAVTTDANAGVLDDLAGYRIYRKGAVADEFELVGNVAATTATQVTAYEDTTALDGASYIYAVSAFDDEATPNESELSDDVSVKTIPSVPQNLAATAGESTIRLTWNAITDASNAKKNENLAGYKVYRKASAAEGNHVFLAQVGASENVYDDATAETGTEYSYVVTSIDNSL